MDKKGIIAVTLSIIIMVVWQFKFAPKYNPPPPAEQSAAAAHSPTAAAAPSATAKGVNGEAIKSEQTTPALASASEKPVVPETAKFLTPAVEYQFTNVGGGIAQATLLKHKAEDDRHVVLNAAGPTPIGAISEHPGEDSEVGYTMVANAQPGEVSYRRTTSRNLQIDKKFTLPSKDKGPDEYLVLLDITFKNTGSELYRTDGYFVHVGSAAPIHEKDLPTYTSFDWYRDGSVKDTNVLWFEPGKIPLIGAQTSAAKTSYTAEADKITWAGVKDQYFTTIISSIAVPAKSVWARRLPLERGDKTLYAIDGAMGMPGFKLAPGESYHQQVKIYGGPKEYARLRDLGNGEEGIMQWGMFKIVSKFLLNSMNTLNGWLGSYAAAILVLTILIKSIMWPLQNRATASMKKMQALQPKMTELREKYKDDPTRMNTEVMKLYKEYGVNPFGGCVPMFIQIPIFFGFYSMLGTAIELRNSHFLWVHDLSQPDTVAHLMGYPINVLPLCMAATMLVQMSMTPKTGDAAQQKIFMFVPLIFIFFCYNFASALALYWTVQNLFSILQLYVTNKQTTPTLTKIAAPKRKK